MNIQVLPEKVLYTISLYLEEPDVTELVLLGKQTLKRLGGNLLVKNRILAYELKYSKAVLKVP